MNPSALISAGQGIDTVGALLREMAHRLFEQHCTREVRLSAEAGNWPAALWRHATDAGLTCATVPESLGGAGASLADACVLMRAAGRYAVPIPLVETLIGNWLLTLAGRPPSDGPLTLSPLATDERLVLHREGLVEHLSGRLSAMPWARFASHLVAMVDFGDGRQVLVQVPLKDCRVVTGLNVAAEPRDGVDIGELPLGGCCFALPAGFDHAARLLQLGAIARCQQMVGAMEWILERSLVYAGERIQFGKPIGSFQSMQHLLAGLAEQVSAAVVAADTATREFEGGDAEAAAGYAKARIGEAAGEVAAQAHQVHGAMGYSHDYPLHFLTRRLWAWRDEFGSERFWNLRAGMRLAGRGGTRLWPEIAR